VDNEEFGHRDEDEVIWTFRQEPEEIGPKYGDYAWVMKPRDEDGDGLVIREPRAPYDGVKDYTDLRVWNLAIDLAEMIYRITDSFPQHERFGLVSQLRRAAVSVPSNIAEGYSRNRTGDYLRFIAIARGSLSEVKTQLIVAARLGYLDPAKAHHTLNQVDQLLRQLTSLYSAIERSPRSGK
jgi:four helix bundle protein